MTENERTIAWTNDGTSTDHTGAILEATVYTALDNIRLFTGHSPGKALGLLLQGVQGAALDVAPAEARNLCASHDRAMFSGTTPGRPDMRVAEESADALDRFADAANRTLAARAEMGSDWRKRS